MLFERFAVAEVKLAHPFHDFLAGLRDQLLARVVGFRGGGDAERDRRGGGGDPDQRLASAGDQLAEPSFHFAFAGTEEFHHRVPDFATAAEPLEDSGGDRFVEHRFHLGGDTGKRKDAAGRAIAARDRHVDPGSRPVRVKDFVAADGEHRLDPVPLRHHPAATAEQFFDAAACRFAKLERGGEEFRQHVAGQVVAGRAEAPGGDDHVGPLDRGAESGQVIRHRIADGGMEPDTDSERPEASAEPGGVRVGTSAAGHLVADRDHFGDRSGRHRIGVLWLPGCLFSFAGA